MEGVGAVVPPVPLDIPAVPVPPAPEGLPVAEEVDCGLKG